MGDLYTVAGTSLRQFVADWLLEIENADPKAYPIVTAVEEQDPSESTFWGAATLMQFIAPRVWGTAGTREQLLLFGVLAVFEKEGEDLPWEGYEAYVRWAFEYLHEIGEIEAARQLRMNVVRRATRPRDHAYEMGQKMLRRSLDGNEGRVAAHERNMAQGDQRELRAADALDPDNSDDPWEMLTRGAE